MSMTGNFTKTMNIGGKVFPRAVTLSADALLVIEDSIPKALPGSLTTRTDNDTGSVTVIGTNTIITGDKVDVYWSGGQRRGMTVGTVAGQVVPIDLGAGDN